MALVGICLRELTWYTVGSGVVGEAWEFLIPTYLLGPEKGYDSWVSFRRRHHFYLPGRKQVCRHDSGLLWCFCHSSMVLASEGLEECVPAASFVPSRPTYHLLPASFSISSLRAVFATQHWGLSSDHFHKSLTFKPNITLPGIKGFFKEVLELSEYGLHLLSDLESSFSFSKWHLLYYLI